MKRRKFLLPILSVCMVVALVSVGFAAWLITGSAVTTTDGGSFNTYNASNEYFEVSVKLGNQTLAEENGTEEDVIIFGQPSGDTSTGWLKPGSDVKLENLSVTATVTLTMADSSFALTSTSLASVLTNLGNKKIVLALDVNAGGDAKYDEKFDDCVTSNYIAYPTMTAFTGTATATWSDSTAANQNFKASALQISLDASNFTYTDSNVATATVTITFAWGTNGNPYTYYKNKDNDKNYANEATTLLKAVYALNSATYSLALSVA